MNFHIPLTIRRAFSLIPFVFFAGLLVLGMEMFFALILDQKPDPEFCYSVGFVLPLIISLCGSIVITRSVSEKQSYRCFLIPFTVVIIFGIIICIIGLVAPFTPFEWPLSPLADVLLTFSILLLTPAMALLLLPFIKEMKDPPVFAYRCLSFFGFISIALACGVFIENILPTFNPEFVWSKFWSFSTENLYLGIFSGLLIFLAMPLTGLLSLYIINRYFRDSPATEGGN